MNKNNNISHLDVHQQQTRTFDESQDAQRVYIVGGSLGNVQPIQPVLTTNSTREIEYKVIEVPTIVKETEIQFVEKEVIVKEVDIRVIGVPTIIEKIVYKEIEKPIVITEFKIVEIPKFIEKVTTIEKQFIPSWLVALVGVETLIIVSSLIHYLIHK